MSKTCLRHDGEGNPVAAVVGESFHPLRVGEARGELQGGVAMPAAADDRDNCRQQIGNPTIDACDRMIDARRYSVKDVAEAYITAASNTIRCATTTVRWPISPPPSGSIPIIPSPTA